jgi:hypothetical protein
MNDTIKKPDFSKYPAFSDFLNKKDHFILDENNNAIPATLLEWGEFLENNKGGRRRVGRDFINDCTISTVFLGLDHYFCFDDDEEPKLHIFETMVFNNDSDIYCERYATWQEAEEGHQKAIEWVKNGCIEEVNENG